MPRRGGWFIFREMGATVTVTADAADGGLVTAASNNFDRDTFYYYDLCRVSIVVEFDTAAASATVSPHHRAEVRHAATAATIANPIYFILLCWVSIVVALVGFERCIAANPRRAVLVGERILPLPHAAQPWCVHSIMPSLEVVLGSMLRRHVRLPTWGRQGPRVRGSTQS